MGNREISERALKHAIVNSFITGSLSYRNQSSDLLCKSMDWFLYEKDLRNERVKKQFFEKR